MQAPFGKKLKQNEDSIKLNVESNIESLKLWEFQDSFFFWIQNLFLSAGTNPELIRSSLSKVTNKQAFWIFWRIISQKITSEVKRQENCQALL